MVGLDARRGRMGWEPRRIGWDTAVEKGVVERRENNFLSVLIDVLSLAEAWLPPRFDLHKLEQRKTMPCFFPMALHCFRYVRCRSCTCWFVRIFTLMHSCTRSYTRLNAFNCEYNQARSQEFTTAGGGTFYCLLRAAALQVLQFQIHFATFCSPQFLHIEFHKGFDENLLFL